MSYRKIMTAVNEKTASTVTGRYAIALALACRAELVLYASHEKGCSETVIDSTARHLDELCSVAAALAVPVKRVMEVGTVSALLPPRAAAEGVDLVLYPLAAYRHSSSDPQRRTVQSLLRKVHSDLAVIRTISLAKPHPGRILVPLGSTISSSERRLVFVSALALSFHAQVTLFHLFAGRTPAELPQTFSRFREQLQDQQVVTLARSGVGDVGKSVRVEAITRQNDLIVLGASQRSVLRRLISGNPVVDVMLQPPCNTVLFRGAL